MSSGLMTLAEQRAEDLQPAAHLSPDLTQHPGILAALPEGYNLGGLFDEIQFSGGLAGMVERSGRLLGTVLLGDRTKIHKRDIAHSVHTLLFSRKRDEIREAIDGHDGLLSLAKQVFLGHLDGLKSYQDRTDLRLMRWILNNPRTRPQSVYAQWARDQVGRITASYTMLPHRDRDDGKTMIENNGLFLTLKEAMTNGPPLELPFSRDTLLFPNTKSIGFTPLVYELNPLEALISEVTLERLTKTIS